MTKQTTPRVEVLFMRAEMFGQVADPFRQDRDLHLGRTGFARFDGIFGDQRLLALGSNRHRDRSLQRLMTTHGRSPPFSIRASATKSRVAPGTDDRAVFEPRRAPVAASCGVTGCPWRNRAASAAVKASAGMSSSTVSIGSRCPEAARLCPREIAKSSEIACLSMNRPTLSRRNSTIWPSVPSASRQVAGERADVGAFAD